MGKVQLIGGIKRRQKPEIWSLDKFFNQHNRILIQRGCGGLGDILMHRMIFEDFKILCPEIKITFACPKQFHQAVRDHPFVDEIVDHMEVDQNDFIIKYDTSTVCGKMEMANAPFSSPHRSDIWANACGITLTKHNMHFHLSNEEKQFAKEQIEIIKDRSSPTIAFAPISAIYGKNLDESQWNPVIKELRELGYFVYGLHSGPIINFDAPQLSGKNTRNFLALINESDYVITVDTATFHAAGGFNKPQVGIFGYTCGLSYGKYYSNWELVQRHRNYTPGWDCGPCYHSGICPKSTERRKPCITEIRSEEIIQAFLRLKIRFPEPFIL